MLTPAHSLVAATLALRPRTIEDADAGYSIAEIVERARKRIDFDEIRDGVTIPKEVLESVTGIDCRLGRFGLAVLAVRDAIVACAKDEGVHLEAKQSDGSLTFLTPGEQAVHYGRAFARLRGRMIVQQVKSLKIDTSRLTEDELREHERGVRQRSFEISSLKLVNGRIRVPEAPSQYVDDRPKRFGRDDNQDKETT